MKKDSLGMALESLKSAIIHLGDAAQHLHSYSMNKTIEKFSEKHPRKKRKYTRRKK